MLSNGQPVALLRWVSRRDISRITSLYSVLTVPIVFNSDDYWVYERFKRYAARMEVIPVPDLPKYKAMAALKEYRLKYFKENLESNILEQVYNLVGGRLTFLNRVAKSEDMIGMCQEICRAEKTWFLNKCGILGEEMDDDVMDQQKYAV